MTSFPAQDEIIAATLRAISKAEESFRFWTNDRINLSFGPQKIITIHVAQEIAMLENAPEIFIDATVSDILRCSLDDREGYVEHMRTHKLIQGTFSVTLDERFSHASHNDSISKVIIAVKNNVINAKPEHSYEIERICKMLDRDACANSALEYGVFAFYAELSDIARKKLNKRMPELLKNFAAIVANFPSLHAKIISSDICSRSDGSQWLAACYIIEPR